MDFLNLPHRTRVQKVVPKNAFDWFTNTKQKKLFADKVHRITWTHKLSEDTLNLESKEIKEIQVFRVELKVKEEIQSLLDIIDKAIPYNIIFFVDYDDCMYISTSVKRHHAINATLSVIDWTFRSGWLSTSENNYHIVLKNSLDAVYKDFCVKLTGKPKLLSRSLSEIVKNQQEIKAIKNEIERLKSQITKCKQFNEKVEMNLAIKEKERALKELQ
jgi:hypothetical protein